MQKTIIIPQLIYAFFRTAVKDIQSSSALTKEQNTLLQEYSQLRTDYVLQEGWPIHDGGIDIDELDQDMTTHYVIAHTNRVIAGMRMTRTPSIQQSLSYRMWDNAVDRAEFEEACRASKEVIDTVNKNEIWDITRLITESNILALKQPRSRALSRVGLFKILARGLSVSDTNDAWWVFTTTERMMKFMKKNGFDVTVVATLKISETDESLSSLCLVQPSAVAHSLKKKAPWLYMIARIESKGRLT